MISPDPAYLLKIRYWGHVSTDGGLLFASIFHGFRSVELSLHGNTLETRKLVAGAVRCWYRGIDWAARRLEHTTEFNPRDVVCRVHRRRNSSYQTTFEALHSSICGPAGFSDKSHTCSQRVLWRPSKITDYNRLPVHLAMYTNLRARRRRPPTTARQHWKSRPLPKLPRSSMGLFPPQVHPLWSTQARRRPGLHRNSQVACGRYTPFRPRDGSTGSVLG